MPPLHSHQPSPLTIEPRQRGQAAGLFLAVAIVVSGCALFWFVQSSADRRAANGHATAHPEYISDAFPKSDDLTLSFARVLPNPKADTLLNFYLQPNQELTQSLVVPSNRPTVVELPIGSYAVGISTIDPTTKQTRLISTVPMQINDASATTVLDLDQSRQPARHSHTQPPPALSN